MPNRLRSFSVVCVVVVAACGGCGTPARQNDTDGAAPLTDAATPPPTPDLAMSPCGPCHAPTALCDAKAKRCVACLADADCPDQSICRASACVPGCAAGHANCGDAGSCDLDGGICHGCLADRDCKDAMNPFCDPASGRCGSCSTQNDRCPDGMYCGMANGKVLCINGCKIDVDCRGGGSPSMACCEHACVDTSVSLAHCGKCGAACNKNACCAGTCADTQADPANCGGCGTACPVRNNVPVCAAGMCGAGACQMGFADCDGDPKNGCEVATASDAKNCGACKMTCAIANASPLCIGGACAIGSCQMGFRDCDKMLGNGCETNINLDPVNCGACNNNCAQLPHAAAGCMAGQCVIGSCNQGFADCNKMNIDGCEAQLDSDGNNCGACGKVCPGPANVQVNCNAGQCSIGGCKFGFFDCNGNAGDGCEVSLQTDAKNCGACGNVCMGMGQNAVAACAGGNCTLACNQGFGDCDNNPANGCEKDMRADVNNCGACGNVCPNNAPVCSGGKCTNIVKSCKDLMGGGAQSGIFMIDPDGAGPIQPFQVYCDMTMDGGGWTLAMSKIVDTSHQNTYGQSITWNCLTSSSPPTSPTVDSQTVMNSAWFAAVNPSDMMLMAGRKILKFYYPRNGVSFTNNYRELTERFCFDSNGVTGMDGPNSGGARTGCGHTNDACTTTDYALWKAHDASCPHDATNSHADGGYCQNNNCGSFGNCPGNGTSPPNPTPNCWFYGGTNAAQVPSLSACPQQSQANWADYNTGFLSGYYNVWIR